jgi:mono/diheme cytochrome c family protein
MRTLLLLALPFMLTTLACDSGGTDPGNSAILDLTGDASAGETVFTSGTCSTASCHGADGISGTAPALSSTVPGLSDDGIINSVLDGKGSMPPQDLSDQEMADVLAWLNASF